MFLLLRRHVPPTRLSLNLGQIPWFTCLDVLLSAFDPASVIFHHSLPWTYATMYGLVHTAILHFHPTCRSLGSRLRICQILVESTLNVLNAKITYKLLLPRTQYGVERDRTEGVVIGDTEGPLSNITERRIGGNDEDGGQDMDADVTEGSIENQEVSVRSGLTTVEDMDEEDFEKGMDKVVASLKNDKGEKITMAWGYLKSQEGRVRGCKLCDSESLTLPDLHI